MQDDLSPISSGEWHYGTAAHLLERAGFGGTPEQISALAALSPSEAVRSLVYFANIDNSHLAPFDHSGIHDPGLEPFPPSRPATSPAEPSHNTVAAAYRRKPFFPEKYPRVPSQNSRVATLPPPFNTTSPTGRGWTVWPAAR